MKQATVFDTQPADSLHALDGRAGRTKRVKEERRWEVWVKTKEGPWCRSNSFETEEAAAIEIAHTIKNHGSHWKKWLALVEVVAVARTNMLTTRTVRSPIDGTELLARRGKPSTGRRVSAEPVGSSDGLAELGAELRRAFHEWWDSECGSQEEKEAGVRYKDLDKRWHSERGHSANDQAQRPRTNDHEKH